MDDGSRSHIDPKITGKEGRNRGKELIISNEMHDYRDITAEYDTRFSNAAFADGNEEDFGLALNDDRKRRRANNNSEGPTHNMDLDLEFFSGPNTNKCITAPDEHTSPHQNIVPNTTESFLMAEPGHQACRQP